MQLLKIKEVSKKMAVAETTLYKMVASGHFLEPYQQGYNKRWLETEVDAWMIYYWQLPQSIPDAIDKHRLDVIKSIAETAQKAKRLVKTKDDPEDTK